METKELVNQKKVDKVTYSFWLGKRNFLDFGLGSIIDFKDRGVEHKNRSEE